MNNERIDVLAVLDKHVESHMRMAVSDAYSAQEYPKLREARVAVAELIAAAREASGTLGHAYHTVLTGLLSEDAHTAYQRLDAALENAGGAE